ncbi:DUF2244 domain-containing protein [uncultured Aliiroseovarius sp.]|uniref:DUF2244 domain-containing protein n=1 Tax=uncultured Aliiroseovarius sp. TaxID=1658783 RepID=UPI002595335C|nr:DUF2244 domain-containing protein [uncultured Aliiroseovarius sp.]
MPYEWMPTDAPDSPQAELHLWPFRSLPRRGFVWVMGIGFSMMLIPLLGLLGSIALWWLLPFALGAMGALWFFIEKSYKDGEILEELLIQRDRITLTRHDPRGGEQHWNANPHWVTVEIHKRSGPVPNYVTLKGNGREVEIGAFLSEDERPKLYEELREALLRVKSFG